MLGIYFFSKQVVGSPGLPVAKVSICVFGDVTMMGSIKVLFPAVDHRRTTFSLDDCHGRDSVDESHLFQFAKALGDANRTKAAADGLEYTNRGYAILVRCR